MTEPLFGTVSPLWSAMPGPQFGYGAAALAAGRLHGTGAPMPFGLPQTAQMAGDPFGNMLTNANVPAAGAIGFPAFAGSEIGIGVGVTAPTLLTAVAMRRGQPLGPTNDQESEDFISEALEILPGAIDVDLVCEGGRATATDRVPDKRLKRDACNTASPIPN